MATAQIRAILFEPLLDDILTFAHGVQIAPMSLYKILEEVKSIRRFQLVQRSVDRLKLRMIAEDRALAFEEAIRELRAFLESKGLTGVEVRLSDTPPQANQTSGKCKHIYRDFD